MTGTYQKLLKDIEKTQAKIAQYEEKGWDVKKVKQYEKLGYMYSGEANLLFDKNNVYISRKLMN